MTDYELTRRDALAALAAGGVGAAGLGALTWDELRESAGERGFSPAERETVVAVAETVYPSSVAGVEAFVERYVVGRVRDRPAYADGVREAVAELDEYAETWEDAPFRDLGTDRRDGVLRSFGVDVSDPDPEGTPAERVRYYLVNDLQYALYTSPTGGALVGIENPQGYPGGTRSYRRPPEAREE